MIRSDLGVYLAIISHQRAQNVDPVQALVGDATWYVADEADADLYAWNGATNIVVGGPLCHARNLAVSDAMDCGLPCVQLSDDLQSTILLTRHGDGFTSRIPTFADVVATLSAACDETGARLAGVAPTDNQYWVPPRPISTACFLVGDCLYIRPNTCRFDEALPLKEDYDYTAQHLSTYGVIARCEWILMTFAHRSNKGGAVYSRNADTEAQAIAYLQAKWGDQVIKPHPSRDHEVVLRWAPPLRG
jgi:TET-associated glycosyltransferase-like protein